MTGPYQLLGRAEGTAECAVTGAMPALFLNKCAAADVFLRFAEPVDETDAESASPSFAVLVYPAYLTDRGGIPQDIAPALTNSTPMFLIAGLADLYRDNGVGYFAAHVAKNRWPKIEAHFYPEGCHGFGVSTWPHNDVYRWERLLATWLRRRGFGIKAMVDVSSDAPDYAPIEPEDGDE